MKRGLTRNVEEVSPDSLQDIQHRLCSDEASERAEVRPSSVRLAHVSERCFLCPDVDSMLLLEVYNRQSSTMCSLPAASEACDKFKLDDTAR